MLISVTGPAQPVQQAAFHTTNDSKTTTTSASGCALDAHGETLVLAPLSLLWPHLNDETKQRVHADTNKLSCAASLSPGTQIEVTTDGAYPFRLCGCFCVPEASHALQDLLRSVRRSDQDWRYGWNLASPSPSSPPHLHTSLSPTPMHLHTALLPPATISSYIAVLEQEAVDKTHKAHQVRRHSTSSTHSSRPAGTQRGQPLSSSERQKDTNTVNQQDRGGQLCAGSPAYVIGSPFGCLAPHQFSSCVFKGVVSSVLYPQQPFFSIPSQQPLSRAAHPSLSRAAHHSLRNLSHPSNNPSLNHPPTDPPAAAFLLDAPVLPGMEGGLVLGQQPVNANQLVLGQLPANTNAAQQSTHRAAQQSVSLETNQHWPSSLPTSDQAPMQPLLNPLGLLALPLCRGRDGVQVPVTIAWPYVHAALLCFLERHKQSTPQLLIARPIDEAVHSRKSIDSIHRNNSSSSQPQAHTVQQDSSTPVIHHTLFDAENSTQQDNPIQRALHGVVLIRAHRSWATGVLISPSLILTNAHLIVPPTSAHNHNAHAASARDHSPTQSASAGAQDVHQQSTSAAASPTPAPQTHKHSSYSDVSLPSCSVHVAVRDKADTTHTHTQHSTALQRVRHVWVEARVLYVLSNHLDLCVLQLQGVNDLEGQLSPLLLFPPHERLSCTGDALVLGHGLFGPSAGLSAAATAGNVAKVVCSDQQRQQPTMVLTTASVHSGASGGAVVDERGRLLGLVTSNARHVSGATLPRLNFCIAAEELRPIVAALLSLEGPAGLHREQASGPLLPTLPDHERDWTDAAVCALRALDKSNENAGRVWRLHTPVFGPVSKL